MNQPDRSTDNTEVKDHLRDVPLDKKQPLADQLDTSPEGLQVTRDLLQREMDSRFSRAQEIAHKEMTTISSVLLRSKVPEELGPSLPKIQFREIEIGSIDFEKAYKLYEESFPAGEREPKEAIEAWIKNDREGRLGKDKYHFQGVFLEESVEAEGKKFEAGSIIGLSSFHYMDKAKSGFLGYTVIEPELRSAGVGSTFFSQLVKTIEEDAGGIGNARAVWMEIDKPDDKDPNTLRRLKFWGRNGVEPLDIDYEFPCLGEHDDPAQLNMMLSVFERNGTNSLTETLKAEHANPNGSTQQSLDAGQVAETTKTIYESIYYTTDKGHPALSRILESVKRVGAENGGKIPRKQIPGIEQAEPIFLPS